MKPGKSGLIRIVDATGYSIKGIAHAWKNEAAFRQESMLAAIMFPAAFLIGRDASQIALLILCLFIVMIAEIINSGLEAIVDLASPEVHPLAGAAKDCGSAAVFFSLVGTLVVWTIIIISNYVL